MMNYRNNFLTCEDIYLIDNNNKEKNTNLSTYIN